MNRYMFFYAVISSALFGITLAEWHSGHRNGWLLLACLTFLFGALLAVACINSPE